MSDQEMTLALRIRANAQQAMQELRNLNSAVGKFTGSGGGQIGRGISMGFGAAGGLLRGILAPLRIAGGLFLGLGASATVFGGAALRAAANDEVLIKRLTAQTGSATKAAAAMAKLEKMSFETGIDTEELAQAGIILDNFGLAGIRNLRAMASAAENMDASIGDVVNAIAAGDGKIFKRMGIDIEESGGRSVISFRNNLGQIKRIAVKEGQDVRKALLGILGGKFSGSDLGGGFTTMLKSLRQGIGQAFGQFGKGLMPAAGEFIKYLQDHLGSLLESGVLEKWGKSIGEKLTAAVTPMLAAFDTLPDVVEALRGAFQSGPENLKKVLLSAAEGFAEILMVSIVEAFSALGGVFMGIGKIMAAAFMENILQLPGMGGTRKKMMMDAFDNASADDQAKIRAEYGTGDLKTLSAASQAKIASQGVSGNLYQQGIDRAFGAIPGAMSRVHATAVEAGGRTIDGLSVAGGMDIAGAYRRNLARRQAGPEMDRYTYIMNGGRGGSFDAPAGKFQLGQAGKQGSTIISIQHLTVQANDARQMQNAVIRSASSASLAPAGN